MIRDRGRGAQPGTVSSLRKYDGERCSLHARLAPLTGRDDIRSTIPAILRNPFAIAVKLMS
jgi:hypothetical protein